ncbi:MAG: ParA family protein [Hyphomicrobiaceae bacterium]
MAVRIAVGNRQGGVGKSTVALMLARYFADMQGQRVLCLDLDTQCNLSGALIGPELVVQQFSARRTIADLLEDRLINGATSTEKYIYASAGDGCANGRIDSKIDLICSSIDLDEVIHDAMKDTSLDNLFNAFNPSFRSFVNHVDERYDVVLFDCPPGISPIVRSAIFLADYIVIPCRPDRISQYAVHRMEHLIYRHRPKEPAAHTTLVNMYQHRPKEDLALSEFEGDFPRLTTRLSKLDAISDVLDWQDAATTFKEKFGDASGVARQLGDEVRGKMEKLPRQRRF